MDKDLIIKKTVLHVLDSTINTPILSDLEIEITDEVKEYLSKHIVKTMQNINNKTYKLTNQNKLFSIIDALKDENFLETTKLISNDIFKLMYENGEIPPADFLFCLISIDYTDYFLAMKLDYNHSYIHKFDMVDNKNNNQIIKFKTNLTNSSQSVQNSFMINLKNYEININEKKYEIEGMKEYFLSQALFGFAKKLSAKQEFDTIQKTTEKFIKDYLDDDVEKKMEVKKEIVNCYLEDKPININNLSKKIFKDDEILAERFNEEIKDKGISKQSIELDKKLEKKITKKQRIKTADGIEILIPIELLNDSEKIIFDTKDDGTVNIILKSVNNMEN